MKVRSRLSWLLPLVLVIWSATGSFGQGTTGQIAGRVLDSQGLAVPGATVTVAGPHGEDLQFQVKSTHLFNAGGAHELKGGLLFDDIDFDRTLDRTGQPITLADGTVTATGAQGEIIRDANVGEIVRVTRANLISTTQSTQEYLTLFVQDTWRPHDRVTITGGLRWDRQRLEGEAQGFTWDENFAPRVVGTVDPLGDGTIKLFANCGRFYGKIPNDLAIRTFSLDPAVTRADFFDRALIRPVPVGTTLNLVSADGTVGAPDDSPWRALPDGSSEWAVLAIGGRTNLGGVYGLARSEAATRLALWALQWSRVLTAAHGPKPLRGQLQMGFELVPFLRAVQNRQTLGFGVSPVFLRWRLLGTRRFQPYLEGLAGIARTDQQLPKGTTRFNFTSQAGLGARVAVSDNLGLLVGYRFHHLSNGGRRPQNPGLNFHVVYVGLSWIRPHDGL